MPNQQTEAVAQALVEMWITSLSYFVKLHRKERGINFMSELSREHCRWLDFEEISTTSVPTKVRQKVNR